MFRDNYRNVTPDEAAVVIPVEPEAPKLLARRQAGAPRMRMSVMQHAPDNLTVTISVFGREVGEGTTFTAHIDRITLDAWGDLLMHAAEDAARPDGEP